MADEGLKEPQGETPEGLKEQHFTITVRFAPGSTDPPVFDFNLTDGMSPLDCIAMCTQGIQWSLEAMEILKRGLNREQRRAEQKNKSRIWTPGSERLQ